MIYNCHFQVRLKHFRDTTNIKKDLGFDLLKFESINFSVFMCYQLFLIKA